MSFIKKLSFHPLFIKIFHWEYWPFAVLYAPLYPYWFWLCLKARAFFYINAANPSIRNGGFLMESKKEIYDILPQGTYPTTLFFHAGTAGTVVLEEVKKKGIQYPAIGKPDIGMRGMSVQKLENDADLLNYAQKTKVDFLVQSYIPYEDELGIFYYRIPGEAKGQITGIVGKELLSVTGDGKSTIDELLQQQQRFILQLPTLRKNIPDELMMILPSGERKLLVPYGNHARGAKFLDVTYLADEKLNHVIDQLAKQIDGFYYGRMDVRYNSIEELREGRNFSIIELNGSGSEPTHMYDPCHSVFFAWKEITRHWAIMYKISTINHKHGVPYMTRKEGLAMLKANGQLVKNIS
ncbi:MAG TPA: D-alanine--D-alanine ligase [Chitinophagaceae bacterium]|nr:D-alanine--D-alanine ligase [Chitinophagaceae bacterium]